jgi:hypothetical protein
MRSLPYSPILLLIACFACGTLSFSNTPPRVEVRRVPDGGIQPQVAVDADGTVHLVYFKGDPAEGNLFYTESQDGTTFSPPIRVNSSPGTAVALGNIRGARIATGRRGSVFVVWNGSAKLSEPALGRSPMLFSRIKQHQTAFEAEKNLIHTAYGLDGGGGIAADPQGRVYVFWHAPIPGAKGEQFRRVWMARSQDDGQSFEPEKVAWEQPTGACGCCTLTAHIDAAERLYVLFRSAEESVHRDMYLLESRNHGASFQGSDISQWRVGYCVMSSEAFVSGRNHTYAAWETEQQIHFGLVDPRRATATDTLVAPQSTNQKYPALAMNADGFLLISWTEGMSWKHGGSAHWKLFDSADHSVRDSGSVEGVPPWSLVAAYPRRNGDFVVLY